MCFTLNNNNFKNPLEHPALIFGFIRFNKIISGFKESIVVVSCFSAVVKYKSVCLAFLIPSVRSMFLLLLLTRIKAFEDKTSSQMLTF